jgi:predicted nucleic acid-binding protein
MIVVADTSPINYLLLMDLVDVLPRLYGRVLLPEAVVLELSAPGAPHVVGAWVKSLPTWIEVVEVRPSSMLELPRLGKGESEAITVAVLRGADLLLMDDAPARRVAVGRGLFVTGTLGVLRDAADEGLLNFRDSVIMIRRFGFRVTDLVVDEILAEE